MHSLGVIPARYGSTRLPAKPLKKIADKCLLEWVIEAVRNKTDLDEIIVATDHEEIVKLAESVGVEAVMTDPELASGSDRVYAASKDRGADIVLNIQGDEPLVKPEWVNQVVASFKDSSVEMATIATDLEVTEMENHNVVKVICDQNQDAIYFSRFGIPHSRVNMSEMPGLTMQHIGLYGFRSEFLARFCDHPRTDLEKAESLEQLRAMYMGAKIKVVKVTGQSIGIDTPEDVKTLEAILKGQN